MKLQRGVSMRSLAWAMFMLIAVAVGAAGINGEFNPVRTRPHTDSSAQVQHVIVKLRTDTGGSAANAAATIASVTSEEARVDIGRQRVVALAARHGLALKNARAITAAMHVMHVEPAGGESAAATLARLRADSEVEYAEIDQRRYIHAVPNDTLYATMQWYLQPSSTTTPAAIDAQTAWDTTTGSSSLVIADLDTGIRFDHPDLLTTTGGGRLISPGYCFITDAFVANNTTCPNADASDPGDWFTSTDISSHSAECSGETLPPGTTMQPSSWHGTRTAGLLGAITNNNAGIAGTTWQGQILPLRVLGKCGGSDSDIAQAMLYAAGIAVTVNGASITNPTPAKIINMSLGGTGTCPATYTDVISQVTAKGVLVVASAGNEGGPVDVPGNCPGVAAVAGLRHIGTKVGFSSLGPEVALSAPAGNCVNTAPGSTCLYPITSTTNPGTTTPSTTYTATNAYTDQVANPNLGTSFSAPLVSGIGALMASVNSNLNSCKLISRLKEGSVAFPQTSSTSTTMCHVPASASDLQTTECICTLDGKTCGAGMASASGAIKAALRPIAAVSVPSTVTAGQSVTLQAGGSAAANTATVASYLWTSVGNHTLSISGGTTATASVTAPSCGIGTVRLTVTDSASRTDTADVVITTTSATTTAPATASGTGSCSSTTPAIEVAVCPTTQSIQVGSSAQSFTADVANTTNAAVTWEVNGTAGGDSTVGTITSTGMYTPPASVPSPATVTIAAVSAADSTVSGSAQVTITPPPSKGGGGGAIDPLTALAEALALGLALGVRGYSRRCAVSSQDRWARR